MSREELLWDHTGEELDDPLIGSYGTEEEEGVRYRYDHLLHDWMVDEKHGLLSCLEIYTSKMATEARLNKLLYPNAQILLITQNQNYNIGSDNQLLKCCSK